MVSVTKDLFHIWSTFSPCHSLSCDSRAYAEISLLFTGIDKKLCSENFFDILIIGGIWCLMFELNSSSFL